MEAGSGGGHGRTQAGAREGAGGPAPCTRAPPDGALVVKHNFYFLGEKISLVESFFLFSFSLFVTRSHVAHAGLELVILRGITLNF